MFNLREGIIGHGDVVEKIERWEVWFLSPNGFYNNIERAISDGVEPETLIPVAAAIGKTLKEAIIRSV